MMNNKGGLLGSLLIIIIILLIAAAVYTEMEKEKGLTAACKDAGYDGAIKKLDLSYCLNGSSSVQIVLKCNHLGGDCKIYGVKA